MFGSRRRRVAATVEVRTRIARAAGPPNGNTRYHLDNVRALPAPAPGSSPGGGIPGGGTSGGGGVILQATDGVQATCVLAPGEVDRPVLIPTAVLPTRQLTTPAQISLAGDQWQSSEGRLAPVPPHGNFPRVGEVLPAVPARAHCLSPAYVEKRRGSDGAERVPHVVVGIDLSVLNRIGDALGTGKLTLIVPVPVKAAKRVPGEASGGCVDKPIAICPAVKDEGVRGIAVAMPLKPDHGPRHYEQIRRRVLDAEKALESRRSPRPAERVKDAPDPEPIPAA